MADFPISDSQYLARNVYPSLELGIEELLKNYCSDSSENKSEKSPVLWLADWLKEHSAVNIAQRQNQCWASAVATVQLQESDPIMCCRNLLKAVKEVFQPIQV